MSRATRPERAAQAGFTLLEVLVALTLLAAAMAAIGSLSSVGRRANRSEIERVELAQVARRLLAEMTEREFAGGSAGESEGYAWRIDVEPMAAPPPPKVAPAAQAPQSSPFGQAAAPAQRQVVWIPYRIILNLRGPTGATTRIVTVRLGRAA